MEGVLVRDYGQPVKRYVQILDLKDDDQLIEAYIKQHSKPHMWREIIDGIKAVGILEMELYIQGNRLVMIVETPLDFDWDKAMSKLAKLPRQQEWEDWNAQYQDCKIGETSDEKWKLMDRMFHLYEYD
ncbi:MAG: L-rhamnose mutarotase [Bacteroidaceae bacterium]|jgi:L-rhamnose mutarotase|nr:L-rhamnose mutarotase [Bacteroidaceae bacterium]